MRITNSNSKFGMGRCGAPPGKEIRMHREAEERHIDGSLEELQGGLVEQVDSGCCNLRQNFSYNTDFGMLDEGGESDV